MSILLVVRRPHALALLAVLLVLPLAASAMASDSKVESTLAKAKTALEKERFERALKLFEDVDRLSGGASFDAMIGASMAASSAGQLEKGLDFAGRATVRAGNDSEQALAAQARGLAFLRADRRAPAVESTLLEALRLDARAAVDSYRYLAELYARLDFEHEAVRLLERYEAEGGDADSIETLKRGIRADLLPSADFDACVSELRAAGHEIPPIGGEAGVEPPLFSGRGEYRPAEILESAAPWYPDDLRQRRLVGEVQTRLIVLENGEIRCLTVLEATHPGFAKATLEAMQEWRFAPAISAGKPAASFFTGTTKFSLR